MRRLLHIRLDKRRPLLGLPPIQQHHIPRRTRRTRITTSRTHKLGPSILAHEIKHLANVRRRKLPINRAVAKKLRLGGGRDDEPEEAVVARVGEDEGGPFRELGVVDGEVGLAGEEWGEGVFAGEDEG